ncbi:MAG: PDZ domain-containing protein [Planctomycetota bacterium]
MRTLLIPSLVLSFGAAHAPLAMAQDPSAGPATVTKKPVSKAPIATESGERASAAQRQQHLLQLGAEGYQDRLTAEEALRQMGEAARASLTKAAAEGSSYDAEVRWRAKRLLRELDLAAQRSGATDASEAGDAPEAGAGGLTERRGQKPHERGRGDGSRQAEQERRGRLRFPPEFEDMQAQVDRMLERIGRGGFGIAGPHRQFLGDSFFGGDSILRGLRTQLPGAMMQGSRGTSVQIGPDGVRVEVSEGGDDEPKVYEAPDMETFRKRYPDVLGEGLGFDGGGSVDWFDRNEALQPRAISPQTMQPRTLSPQTLSPQTMQPVAPAKGRRLGVTVRELPDALRDYLDLPNDVGLMVGEVQADTLASSLGLQPRDIVTKIQQRSIGSAQDVGEALAAIAKGESVVVELVRRGRVETASAKKRFDAVGANAEGSVDSPRADGKLEPRKKRAPRRIR